MTLFGMNLERCGILKKQKDICKINAFDLLYHLVYFLKCFLHVLSSKIDGENIYPHSLAILHSLKFQVVPGNFFF